MQAVHYVHGSHLDTVFARVLHQLGRRIKSQRLSSPWFTEAQLTHLERALSQVMGPLAKMLVKKQVARHTSLEALREALAHEIDHATDREKFLTATQKLP